MSDRNWLFAIRRYQDDEERSRGKGFINGGARQLASELRAATKANPARFATLMHRIPSDSNTAYMHQILSGLAEADGVDEDVVTEAIRFAHEVHERPYGNEIARLVERHPDVWTRPDIPEYLIWYALFGEATETDAVEKDSVGRETITIENLIQRAGGLHIRGINGVRGWAWEALSSILWKTSELDELAWAAFDYALKKERLVSVRCCMMRALTPLFNRDKLRFEASLVALIGLDDDSPVHSHPKRLAPLITHSGVRLFPYILSWLPALARRLLDALLKSDDRTMALIAAWFVFGRSFQDNDFVDEATHLAGLSAEHRRLMAGVAGEVLPWTDQTSRAEAVLKSAFFDDDKEVRSQSSNVFRHIKPHEVEKHIPLADVFLRSPSFGEHGFSVLHMLDEATCDTLDLIILAAEMTATDIDRNGNRGSRRGMDLHHIQDLLKAEYNASERNPGSRKRILDVIDHLLVAGISGIDSVVAAHDRW